MEIQFLHHNEENKWSFALIISQIIAYLSFVDMEVFKYQILELCFVANSTRNNLDYIERKRVQRFMETAWQTCNKSEK